MSDGKIHKDEYMALVPGCCRLRTWEAHCDIMLCWGITIKSQGSTAEKSPCGMCEYNAEPAGDFARIAWLEQQQKQRVWDALSG